MLIIHSKDNQAGLSLLEFNCNPLCRWFDSHPGPDCARDKDETWIQPERNALCPNCVLYPDDHGGSE